MGLLRRGLIGGTLATLTAVLGAGGAQAATTVTFHLTSAEQTFAVPAGVTTLHATVIGGRGGSTGSALGGFGGLASADLSVAPGQVLYIEVGGNGASGALSGTGNGGPGGFNGGGQGGDSDFGSGGSGGGGASELRATPLATDAGSSAPRLSGGGAGGGDNHTTMHVGAGGAAGSGGANSSAGLGTAKGGDGATVNGAGSGGTGGGFSQNGANGSFLRGGLGGINFGNTFGAGGG